MLYLNVKFIILILPVYVRLRTLQPFKFSQNTQISVASIIFNRSYH